MKGISNFVLLSLGMGLLGFGLITVAPALEEQQILQCEEKAMAKALETSALSCPSPLTPELQIVRSCQGLISYSTLNESGEEIITKVPKTMIFLKSPQGIPSIVTTKVFNLRFLDFAVGQVTTLGISDVNEPVMLDHGLHAEHGTLDGLRLSDRHRSQTRYDTLLQDAAEACLGSPEEFTDFEIRSAEFINEIEKNATAYITFDMGIQNSDARVVVYYEMNGKVYSMDLPLELRPI